MREQFDSCSYEELTYCIKARIKDIREFREFLKDEYSYKYKEVRTSIMFKTLISKSEIRRLLKMRRVLKKSQYKNWDSSLL